MRRDFYIKCQPKPWQRERMVMVKGKGGRRVPRFFTPAGDYKTFMETVRVVTKNHVQLHGPIEARTVRMSAIFWINPPAQIAELPEMPNRQVDGDIDNYLGGVMDGLVHGGLFKNDSVVCDLTGLKRWATLFTPPGVTLAFEWEEV